MGLTSQRCVVKALNNHKDLTQILAKMNKGIDWDLRELAKEEKYLQRSEQKFQVQLLETKIKMLKEKIDEKVAKRNNIQNTLNELKQQEVS
jgi:DNA repair exonuclease SbcCD ATPase subunit